MRGLRKFQIKNMKGMKIMKERKFKNERFITRGVAESLNPLLVMLLWEMIDNLTI